MRAQISSKLAVLAVWAVTSCAESSGVEEVAENAAEGSLTLGLTGLSPSGSSYRLRDAIFQISGCADSIDGGGYYPYPYPAYAGTGGTLPVAGEGGGGASCSTFELSSEDDLDAPSVSKRVLPGYYTIVLLDGWHLERASTGGWADVDRALLLSPKVQQQYVWDQGAAYVNYSFGVDGDLIDFRHGDINIGISVQTPGEVGSTGGYGGSYPYPVPAGRGGTAGVAGSAAF